MNGVKRLLIRQVLFDGRETDVLIEERRFARIAPRIEAPDAEILDGRGRAIVPPFYNAHGHAAMTLFRGFADDIALFPWLQEHIWPAEARLTADDVACATRLAIVEMIRGGTVFFNDMYWEPATVARVADEMGVRAAVVSVLVNAAATLLLFAGLVFATDAGRAALDAALVPADSELADARLLLESYSAKSGGGRSDLMSVASAAFCPSTKASPRSCG